MSSTQTRTDASTSSSSRRTTTTTNQSNKRTNTKYQTPPLYTIDRVTTSNGVSTEVLTIEDTPPLPTPNSSNSRSNSSFNNHSGHSNYNDEQQQQQQHQQQSNKKRRNNLNSSSLSQIQQQQQCYPDHHSSASTASSSSYRKDQGVSTSNNNSSHAIASSSKNTTINNHNNSTNTNGSTTTTTTTVKGKRKLDAYQGYATNGKESSSSNGKAREKPQAEPEKACDKDGHYIVNPRGSKEILNGRYTVHKLLGQGTFGKVVSAFDSDEKKYVAIKIIRAIKKYTEASKVEIKVLNMILKNDPEDINKCIHVKQVFNHKDHVCIVTELLSSSVFDFLKENQYHPFPFSHIQHFAKQLLNSVRFLHSLKLIHTDLKPENILLETTNHSIQRSTRLKKNTKVLDKPNLRLIDFGSATFEPDYHASVVSTRHYRAPEIILGTGWSYPCDSWSIGCILIEFYTGEALFQTHENVEHLAMMEKVFGIMPSELMRAVVGGKDKEKAAYFIGNGRNRRLDFPTAATTKQSKSFVDQMKTLPEIIKPNGIAGQRFLDLLEQLLRWEPSQRITPEKALSHAFFSVSIEDEGSASISKRGRI